MKKYPNLMSSKTIRGQIFKNRVIAAPMLAPGIFDNATGLPTEKAAVFYGRRAMGGAAAVTMGESPVNYTHAVSRVLTNCLSDVMFKEDYFRRVTYSVRRHGALASIQLYHIGMMGDNDPMGPTGFVRSDGVRVREMTRADMDEVIEDFARCSANAKVTGFDMVMIHGGHGWLLSQFASPRTNMRTDEYGGSAENRARFANELLDAVRARVGEDFIIEYRISGDELIEDGMKIDDTIEYIRQIEDKIDIVNVSVGTMGHRGKSENYMYPLWYLPYGVNIENAAKLKSAVKCAVSVVGGIMSPEMAEDVIASGKADFVTMNRALLADPDWCLKTLEGRDDEIRPCIRCINCHDYVFLGEGSFCSVNPRAMEEHWLAGVPEPKEQRKVVVIGGGVGGMQAAITAAERGHDVTLFEKSDKLGGIMKFTDFSPVKKDLKRYKDSQIRRLMRTAADVRLGVGATPELVMAEKPHTVICAVGSEPAVPAVPGIDGKNVCDALEAYRNLDKIGDKTVIIGGNLTGVELGIDLARLGKSVTVVEMADKIAAGAPMFYMGGIEEELEDCAELLKCVTGQTCTKITPEGVETEDSDGKKSFIEADSVIYAVGMRPNAGLAESFRETALHFRSIGDCRKAKRLKDAVEAGYLAAIDIF